MHTHHYLILFLFCGLGYFIPNNNSISENTPSKESNTIISKQDSLIRVVADYDCAANAEIWDKPICGCYKLSSDIEVDSVYWYYRYEEETADNYDVWSDIMFGRCCTEADLTYAEILNFNITADLENKKYPISHMIDGNFTSAYVFKENEFPKINITLNFEDGSHSSFVPDAMPNKLLKDTDTLLYPFRLSLVNGYTKSKKTYEENTRIKEMEAYINSEYQATIRLKDTPFFQAFGFSFSPQRHAYIGSHFVLPR